MREQGRLWFGLFFALLLVSWGSAQRADPRSASTSSQPSSIRPFLGRWDLTLKTLNQDRPSWIELSERRGQLNGLMVGFWGHATPTGAVQLKDGGIEFTAPADEGFDEGTLFKGKLSDGQFAGTATSPKGSSWPWTGQKAPALERTNAPKRGKPVRLFNGKDLSGWMFADLGHSGVWSVEDGTLVKTASGSELVSTPKFRDFKLHVEFNCGPMASSGVYLQGRYEVQIETDSTPESPDRSMGAVYGFLTPEPALPRTPNVW